MPCDKAYQANANKALMPAEHQERKKSSAEKKSPWVTVATVAMNFLQGQAKRASYTVDRLDSNDVLILWCEQETGGEDGILHTTYVIRGCFFPPFFSSDTLRKVPLREAHIGGR